MTYPIRPTTPADTETLIRLRMEFLAELNEDKSETLVAEVAANVRAYYEQAVPAGDYLGWFAEDSGVVVGSGGLVLFRKPPNFGSPNGLDGYVMNVYTVPSHRRRGIARAMMEVIVAHAREADVRRLWLHASPGGKPLYASLGFVAGEEMKLRL